MKQLLCLLSVLLFASACKAQTDQSNSGPNPSPPAPMGQQGWIPQNISTTDQIGYASLLNKDTAWVSTLDGLLTTHDGGANWLPWSSPTIGAVSFADRLNGIVVGTDGIPLHVFHTSDGGQHWDTIAISNMTPFTSIARIGKDTIFMTGGGIARSTNGGATWSYKQMGLGLNSINFCNSKVGFAVGTIAAWFGPPQRTSAAEVYVTEDGGEHWFPRYSGIKVELTSVKVYSSLGAIVGGANSIAYTSDGGDLVGNGHWPGAKVESPVPVVAQLSFPSVERGYGCGNGGSIIFTADSGRTWIHQKSGSVVNLNSICFADDSNGFATGEQGVILHTANGGRDWVQTAPPSNTPIQVSSYPQPSTGIIQLTYFLPQLQHVTFAVYDVTGKLVTLLADHQLEHPGDHTLIMDGTNLPVGVYCYQLQTDRYQSAGKITLVK